MSQGRSLVTREYNTLCYIRQATLHILPPLLLPRRLARKPFNPQPLISHLTNSNGCGNLIPGSANVSPLGTLLLPQPRVYSQPSDFSRQPRNVSHAVSYSCRLFFSLGALFRARFVYFQQLADSCAKHRGCGVSLRYLSALCVSALSFSSGSVAPVRHVAS